MAGSTPCPSLALPLPGGRYIRLRELRAPQRGLRHQQLQPANPSSATHGIPLTGNTQQMARPTTSLVLLVAAAFMATADARASASNPAPASATAADETGMCSSAGNAGVAPEGCFLYFAYGSNLLTERLRMANPSATRVAAARVQNQRLGFGFWSGRWGGAVATLLPAPGEHVWGAVWALRHEHRASLDDQEGVSKGIYEVLEVDAETADGRRLPCRSYRLRVQPPSAPTPEEAPRLLPSKIYWQVIVAGAEESQLPEEYQQWLRELPHNNHTGGMEVGKLAQGLSTPLAPPVTSPAPPASAAGETS